MLIGSCKYYFRKGDIVFSFVNHSYIQDVLYVYKLLCYK